MLGESARVASKCLGVKLGVLEPDAAADLILTSYRPATLLTAENLASHFLFAMGSEYVRDVMVAGWWLMRKGHVVTCNEAAVRFGGYRAKVVGGGPGGAMLTGGAPGGPAMGGPICIAAAGAGAWPGSTTTRVPTLTRL